MEGGREQREGRDEHGGRNKEDGLLVVQTHDI